MSDQPDLSIIENFGLYDPVATPIIYHYCCIQTLIAIAQSKTIRLSDVNTMNDFGEMHWGYDRFIEAINQYGHPNKEKFYDDVDQILSNI
ncbi:MAG: hypothetical protein ABJM86_09240, partial [Hyphomicrobiales bacterium]